MGKYAALYRYLQDQPGDEVSLSFQQVESIIGDTLPASAHNHRAWWANTSGRSHVEAREWLAAGWKVKEVSLTRGQVLFTRDVEGR